MKPLKFHCSGEVGEQRQKGDLMESQPSGVCTDLDREGSALKVVEGVENRGGEGVVEDTSRRREVKKIR